MNQVRRSRTNGIFVALVVVMFLIVVSIGMIFIAANQVLDSASMTAVSPPRPTVKRTRDAAPPHVTVPRTELDHLRQIEARAIEAIRKVQPAIVGVMSPEEASKPPRKPHAWGGSGIIISSRGIVLSRASISHMSAATSNFLNPYQPGSVTTVFLADGTECKARLLGANMTYDVALLQLPEPGPYPCITLDDQAHVVPGEWVISLGHLFGFREGRLANASLGRVLSPESDGAFMTDCAAYRGGCYFDLDGRFAGIASFGVPLFDVESPIEPVFATVSAPRIAALQASMSEKQMPAQGFMRFLQDLTHSPRLANEDWTNGEQMKAIVSPLAAPLRSSVVTILNGGIPIGFGTVVNDEGLAVVKATILPPQAQCRLPDGSIVDVNVIGVDKPFDVALIRLPRESVQPVNWTDRDEFPVGTIVAAVGAEQKIQVVGIVSVGIQNFNEPGSYDYDLPLRVKAQMPHIYGERSDKGGYELELVGGLAKSAGLRPGDRLSSIAGIQIETAEDIKTSVRERLTGDVVPVVFVREGETMTVQVPLEAEGLYSERTHRNEGFPIAFQYTQSVPNTACGSPLIDLNGNVIGITVGGPEDRAGWAIPRDAIRKLMAEAKAGRLEP